ncbi:MAG: hypothetical protein ACXWZL_01245 [Mycobacterium sp.]|jgi:hypothetical protein
MCLTLANAATILDHPTSVPPACGYTRTLHHAGHLSPGDLWCAVAGEHPHTAILVTDQCGATGSVICGMWCEHAGVEPPFQDVAVDDEGAVQGAVVLALLNWPDVDDERTRCSRDRW